MPDEPAPISLPHRRRRERILIALISAMLGAGLASAAFAMLGGSDAPASGADAPPTARSLDETGPTPLLAPSVARMKAPPPATSGPGVAEDPTAEPPLTADDRF